MRSLPEAITRRLLLLVAILLALPDPAVAEGAGGGPLAALGCGACHRLEAPAAEERTLAEYAQRKAPDLFYAGSKYREEWLRTWLARPTPIRPAGLHPGERTETEPGGDVVLPAGAAEHPAVPKEKIEAVVAALGRLDWGGDLLPKEAPPRAPVPRALAELNFVKFKGCGSCHRTADESAPLSGPDLDDAFERLRPEFLASFLENPQAWDPVAPMPNYQLPAPEVGKLVTYLRILSEENHGAKAR